MEHSVTCSALRGRCRKPPPSSPVLHHRGLVPDHLVGHGLGRLQQGRSGLGGATLGTGGRRAPPAVLAAGRRCWGRDRYIRTAGHTAAAGLDRTGRSALLPVPAVCQARSPGGSRAQRCRDHHFGCDGARACRPARVLFAGRPAQVSCGSSLPLNVMLECSQATGRPGSPVGQLRQCAAFHDRPHTRPPAPRPGQIGAPGSHWLCAGGWRAARPGREHPERLAFVRRPPCKPRRPLTYAAGTHS